MKLYQTGISFQVCRKEPFYADALGIYMESFDFDRLPIDIALRKLLSELYLPPETQQIDRVMEAFAQRYHGQNPNVFSNSGMSPDRIVIIALIPFLADQAYVLSFSLIMLHTDHFNKNNKNRMTKADYLRNTKIEGVSDLLLSVRVHICHGEIAEFDSVSVRQHYLLDIHLCRRWNGRQWSAIDHEAAKFGDSKQSESQIESVCSHSSGINQRFASGCRAVCAQEELVLSLPYSYLI